MYKIEFTELKNKIMELKNIVKWSDRRLDEEEVNDLKFKAVEVSQSEWGEKN